VFGAGGWEGAVQLYVGSDLWALGLGEVGWIRLGIGRRDEGREMLAG
jgi:hypothetical protein